MKAGMPFILHVPSYKHPHEQTETSRYTDRLEKNLLFREQVRET
jgi:hypothetical protein